MNNLYHKITAAASTATLLALPSIASAQTGLGDAATFLGQANPSGAGSTSDPNALPQMIGRGINALLGILGILLVVYIIWAGFTWMTASGDPDKVKHAKSMLQQAVIGMVIIISAYAIAGFVLNILTTAAGA